MIDIKLEKRVKNELSTFKNEIEKISIDSARQKGFDLLKLLNTKLINLQETNSLLLSKSIDPAEIREKAEELISIRLKIVTLIKDSKSIK